MHLVVTGKEGQLTRALQALGPPRGWRVTALGRPGLDLADAAGARRLIAASGADIVVNAAAYTAVDKAESEPDVAMAVNGAGAGAVAAGAADIGAPIIHISTDCVFAGDIARPYVETDSTDPLSIYGATKLRGEQLTASATPDHAILRTSWVFGPAGRNFIHMMLKLAETKDSIGVVADQFGCPTYVDDLAEAVLAVAGNLREQPSNMALRGVFHCTGEGSASRATMAEAVFAGSAARGGRSSSVTPVPASTYPQPARRPANAALDCGKLADAHGVRLPRWQDGLERCLDVLIGPRR